MTNYERAWEYINKGNTHEERIQRAVFCWRLGDIKEWEIKYVK